jgi:hypothetical protein
MFEIAIVNTVCAGIRNAQIAGFIQRESERLLQRYAFAVFTRNPITNAFEESPALADIDRRAQAAQIHDARFIRRRRPGRVRG